MCTKALWFLSEGDARATRQTCRTCYSGSELHYGPGIVPQYAVQTGNVLVEQFEPWYFGVAFAFAFKFCTGMPDMPPFAKHPRHRRTADAPNVFVPLWVRLMAGRVEQQIRRDWHLSYAMGSFLFRTSVNLCRQVYSYKNVGYDRLGGDMTPEDLCKGAQEICHGLAGTYIDLNGRSKKSTAT